MVRGDPAFAYRIESGSGKSYLCEKRVPVEDVPEARIMADEGKGTVGTRIASSIWAQPRRLPP
jgi:hypothetical protein